uniref:glutathione transferase n=1 Tax=Ditylenchus dipsaci TaxID=166011 RepID=A0A915CW15_9BILA
MIFHYAKIPFEDVRISQDSWPDIKSSTRFGKLPELEVNGKKLAQSMAIGRYLGEKFGLGGSDEWQKQKTDEMGDLLKDFTQELSIYIGVALGMRDGDKTSLRKEIYLPTVNRYLPIFEQQIINSGSGFLTEMVTWVDFFVEEYLTTLHNIEKNVFKNIRIWQNLWTECSACPN